ncbi:hypothetical protein L1887_22801 [Cichorium endivia]|nr:hypothetical protein L1887_22801 [Cichorium endivia]
MQNTWIICQHLDGLFWSFYVPVNCPNNGWIYILFDLMLACHLATKIGYTYAYKDKLLRNHSITILT